MIDVAPTQRSEIEEFLADSTKTEHAGWLLEWGMSKIRSMSFVRICGRM